MLDIVIQFCNFAADTAFLVGRALSSNVSFGVGCFFTFVMNKSIKRQYKAITNQLIG